VRAIVETADPAAPIQSRNESMESEQKTSTTLNLCFDGVSAILFDERETSDEVDLIEHFYSAHIHSIDCSWRLVDVLACSQKVSHPEMRLVSAAIGASFHFPF
jgi:hypothetical protein